MIAFGIISVLVLLLIYFVLRAQNFQRQLALSNHNVRSSTKRANYAYNNLVMISNELQQVFMARLESNHKRGMIGSGDYQILSALFSCFSTIVMECCEKEATVEEALNKVLMKLDFEMEDLKNCIKEQPSDIRVAWSKNTVDGFIAACNKISQGALSVQASDN